VTIAGLSVALVSMAGVDWGSCYGWRKVCHSMGMRDLLGMAVTSSKSVSSETGVTTVGSGVAISWSGYGFENWGGFHDWGNLVVIL